MGLGLSPSVHKQLQFLRVWFQILGPHTPTLSKCECPPAPPPPSYEILGSGAAGQEISSSGCDTPSPHSMKYYLRRCPELTDGWRSSMDYYFHAIEIKLVEIKSLT